MFSSKFFDIVPIFAEPYFVPLTVQTPAVPPPMFGIEAPPPDAGGVVVPPPVDGAGVPVDGAGAPPPVLVAASKTALDDPPGVKVPRTFGHICDVNGTSWPAAFALPYTVPRIVHVPVGGVNALATVAGAARAAAMATPAMMRLSFTETLLVHEFHVVLKTRRG
jgi:hypothetical protein